MSYIKSKYHWLMLMVVMLVGVSLHYVEPNDIYKIKYAFQPSKIQWKEYVVEMSEGFYAEDYPDGRLVIYNLEHLPTENSLDYIQVSKGSSIPISKSLLEFCDKYECNSRETYLVNDSFSCSMIEPVIKNIEIARFVAAIGCSSVSSQIDFLIKVSDVNNIELFYSMLSDIVFKLLGAKTPDISEQE